MEEGQPLWSSRFPQEEPLAPLIHLELFEILFFELNKVANNTAKWGHIWTLKWDKSIDKHAEWKRPISDTYSTAQLSSEKQPYGSITTHIQDFC